MTPGTRFLGYESYNQRRYQYSIMEVFSQNSSSHSKSGYQSESIFLSIPILSKSRDDLLLPTVLARKIKHGNLLQSSGATYNIRYVRCIPSNRGSASKDGYPSLTSNLGHTSSRFS